MSGTPNAESNGVEFPPDPYKDVAEGAACAGLYGDFDTILCGTCPVKQRCNDLYMDLQFGSLARPQGRDHDSDVIAVLTGPWGGHAYSQNGSAFMRDGKRWLVEDRPKAPSWAT